MKSLIKSNKEWLLFLSGTAIVRFINVLMGLLVAASVNRSEFGFYGMLLTYLSFSLSFLSLGRVNDALTKKNGLSTGYLLKTFLLVFLGSFVWIILFKLLSNWLELDIFNLFKASTLYFWLVAYMINNIAPSLLISIRAGDTLFKVSIAYTFLSSILVFTLEWNLILMFYLNITLAGIYLFMFFNQIDALKIRLNRNLRFSLIPSVLNTNAFKFWVSDVLWATINLAIVLLIGRNSIELLGDYSLYNQLLFILLFIPTTLMPYVIKEVSHSNMINYGVILANKHVLISILSFLGLGFLMYMTILFKLPLMENLVIDSFLFLCFMFAGFGQVLHGINVSGITAIKGFKTLPLLKLIPKLSVFLFLILGFSNLSEMMIVKGVVFLLSMVSILFIRSK